MHGLFVLGFFPPFTVLLFCVLPSSLILWICLAANGLQRRICTLGLWYRYRCRKTRLGSTCNTTFISNFNITIIDLKPGTQGKSKLGIMLEFNFPNLLLGWACKRHEPLLSGEKSCFLQDPHVSKSTVLSAVPAWTWHRQRGFFPSMRPWLKMVFVSNISGGPSYFLGKKLLYPGANLFFLPWGGGQREIQRKLCLKTVIQATQNKIIVVRKGSQLQSHIRLIPALAPVWKDGWTGASFSWASAKPEWLWAQSFTTGSNVFIKIFISQPWFF